MYVVRVFSRPRSRLFLVQADSASDARNIMIKLNNQEREAGEELFERIEYVETVEFEQNVMEL